MRRFEVLSPDRITIEFENPYYESEEKALNAFEKWKKRYETQGYYSSASYGKILLDELINYTIIREINNK